MTSAPFDLASVETNALTPANDVAISQRLSQDLDFARAVKGGGPVRVTSLISQAWHLREFTITHPARWCRRIGPVLRRTAA